MNTRRNLAFRIGDTYFPIMLDTVFLVGRWQVEDQQNSLSKVPVLPSVIFFLELYQRGSLPITTENIRENETTNSRYFRRPPSCVVPIIQDAEVRVKF